MWAGRKVNGVHQWGHFAMIRGNGLTIPTPENSSPIIWGIRISGRTRRHAGRMARKILRSRQKSA